MNNADTTQRFIAGNYFDKYSSNFYVHRRLVGGFLRDARELITLAMPRNVLEVGCANGDLASQLLKPEQNSSKVQNTQYVGVDICSHQIEAAAKKYPSLGFQIASAYELPFPDASFDLVIACEVLEHLQWPARALHEAARVSRGYVLVSVPWEPVWRLLNMARGKYWRGLGNTPGHLQHFSRREIRDLLNTKLMIVAERRPFPWTMFLAKPLRTS